MISHRLRSHRIELLALTAILALATFAGTISAPQHASGQEAEQVRFAFWGDPAEQAAYQRVVDAFQAANPEIEISVDYTAGQGDYYRKIASDFAAGDPPDVFLTNYRQFGQYAGSDALAPIQPYLDSSPTLSASDFYPLALDAFRYGEEGDLTCLPQNISSLVVYYNREMFEEAGVPLPEDGWSWETFIDAAQRLTVDTDGDGTIDQYGVVVEPSMYRMVSFIWGAGGEIVDDINQPTTLTIDTPEAIEGLERFVSLGASGYGVVPPEEEVAALSDQDRFMDGGAAMYIQSRRPVPTLREIQDFEWDVTSLPVIDQPATVLHSDAFCMASAGESQESAWAFIEFAGSAEGQTLLAETGRTVPSMIAVSQSDVFLEGASAATPDATGSESAPLPPANSQLFLDNIEVMRRVPSISTWIEVEDAFDAEFDRSLYIEDFDVAAAAEAAIENSRDAFERAAS